MPLLGQPGTRRWLLSTVAILCVAGPAAAQDPEPFLGQPLPDTEPEIFAPGLVSKPDAYEYGSVWSADGREFYFGVNVGERAEIRGIRWTDGGWTPEFVVVGHPAYTFGDPFLSPDEQRLYFISNRPLGGLSGPAKDFDLWYVDRRGEGWSEPIRVGGPVNSSFDEYYVSFSAEGRLYFASNRAGGDRSHDFDIYSAEPSGSGFARPRRVPGNANTRHYEADAFVARDESYVIYSSSRPEGLGQGDLYVSFRREDGSWAEGISLGPSVNTEGHELCPFVTADGRFFFFTSNEDIYWVDASILNRLRSSQIRE